MIVRKVNKTALVTDLGSSLRRPLSCVPAELFDHDYSGEYLRYGPVPRIIRELWYRGNAIKDAFAGWGGTELFSDRSLKNGALALYLAAVAGFSRADVECYVLDPNRSVSVARKEFLGYFRRWEYRERRNSFWESMVLRNKLLTLRVLEHNHIPCSSVKAVLGTNSGFLCSTNIVECSREDILNGLGAGQFVHKPLFGRWGSGIGYFSIDHSAMVEWDGHPGRVSWRDFCTALIADMQSGYLMIEDKLANHVGFANTDTSALSTIRVVTVRQRNNAVQPLFAVVRYGERGSLIDNWSAGGFACPIELSSGLIGKAMRKRRRNSDNRIGTTGMRVPDWADALTIAVKSHSCFENMRSIGWDIAITDNGPLVIEGNDDWDVILPQQVCGLGLIPYLTEQRTMWV